MSLDTALAEVAGSTSAPLCLLRLPQVKVRVGLQRTAIYDGVKDGTFPKPISLGRRCVAWRSDEIDAWIRERIVQSRLADAARAGQ